MNRGRGGSFSNYNNRGGGRGGYRDGPAGDPLKPSSFSSLGTFLHSCENDMVVTSTLSAQVPHFNAYIFLENHSPVGRIDEILGPINQVTFTIKTSEGVVAKSFKKGDKFFIGSDKLLPIERFLPKLPQPKVKKPKSAAGGVRNTGMGSGGRGGRGGFRGGRGGSSRGGQSGFGSRGGSSFGNRGGSSSRGGSFHRR